METLAYLALTLTLGGSAPLSPDLTAVFPGSEPGSRATAVAWSKSKGCFVSGSYMVDTAEELVVVTYCQATRIRMVVGWAQWRRDPQAIIERTRAKLHADGLDDLEVLPLQPLKDGATAAGGGVTLAWKGARLIVQTDGAVGPLPYCDLPVPGWRPTGVAFAPSPDRRNLFLQYGVLEDDGIDANVSDSVYRYQEKLGWRPIKQ